MKKENVPAYELVSCQDIPDIHSKGSLWRHKKSGARVMVLENDDENKVFNIAFRTPLLTVPVWPIFWSTVSCAVPRNSP